MGDEEGEIGVVGVNEEKKQLVKLVQELKGVTHSINQNFGQLHESSHQPPHQQWTQMLLPMVRGLQHIFPRSEKQVKNSPGHQRIRLPPYNHMMNGNHPAERVMQQGCRVFSIVRAKR